MGSYTPATKTLPVFAKIHEKGDREEESESCAASEASENELSDIEMSPEMIKNAIFGASIEKPSTEAKKSAANVGTHCDTT